MKRILFVAFVAAAATSARAETMAEAFAGAWTRHPEAVAFGDHRAEIDARARAALALSPGPASVSIGNLSDRLSGNRGRDEWEIEIGMPLWLAGQRSVRQREAEASTLELEARRAALQLALAGELRALWWDVALRRQARDSAAQRLDSAQALENAVLRRHAARDLALIDVNLARGERLAAQQEHDEAAEALRRANLDFTALTGVDPPGRLDEERPAPTPDVPARHPQLASAHAAARAASARLGVARFAERESPTVAARIIRERGQSGEAYASAIGVRLTIPLSFEPHYRQGIASASAESSRAEAQVALALRQVRIENERARGAFAQANDLLALANERAQRAGENLALAEKAFRLGEFDLATLLRARADALVATAQASRQRIEIAAARSRLNQAIGVLP